MMKYVGFVTFAVANVLACSDDSSFVDEDGYTCSEWKGYDCDNAEVWGISEAGKQDLIESCCASCNLPAVTYPEGDACKDGGDFRDAKGYTCDDWEGYRCDNYWPGYSYDDLQDVRDNCCETCAATCIDNWLFFDEDGYRCVDWQGYDCRAATEKYEYSAEGQGRLLKECCATCKAFEAAEGCSDVDDFEDEEGYACDDWAGYTCIIATEIYEYSPAGEQALLENCCNTCTANCVDDFWFTDAKGYECSDWEGYDCNTAVSEWDYSMDNQYDILDNCCKTCSAFAGGDDSSEAGGQGSGAAQGESDEEEEAAESGPLDLAAYTALCENADDAQSCEDFGCKFKSKKGKATCKAATTAKKVKCKKVKNAGVCERLGCTATKKSKCKGQPQNL